MSCAWALDAKPAPPVSPQSQKRKGNLQEKQLQEKKKNCITLSSDEPKTRSTNSRERAIRKPVHKGKCGDKDGGVGEAREKAVTLQDGDVGKAVTSLFAHVDGLIRLF
jgi:hypothetical protein